MAEVGHNLLARQQKDANSVVHALVHSAVGLFFVVFGQYKIFGSGLVHSKFRD